MSQLLQGLAGSDGRIPATDGISAAAFYARGLPFEPTGQLAVTLNGTVANHHQGLPFTAAGRLSVEQGIFSYYGSGAAPFASSGRLLISASVPDTYLAGVGYVNISSGVSFNIGAVASSIIFVGGVVSTVLTNTIDVTSVPLQAGDIGLLFYDSGGISPTTGTWTELENSGWESLQTKVMVGGETALTFSSSVHMIQFLAFRGLSLPTTAQSSVFEAPDGNPNPPVTPIALTANDWVIAFGRTTATNSGQWIQANVSTVPASYTSFNLSGSQSLRGIGSGYRTGLTGTTDPGIFSWGCTAGTGSSAATLVLKSTA
jgi:hypothetical protein